MITHYAEIMATDPYSGWAPKARESAIAAANDCRNNPDWDNHSMMAGFIYGAGYSHAAYVAGDKKAKNLRGSAKVIFLGRCYGMGGGKLCRSLGLPVRTVVRDPDSRTWLVHSIESERGKALLAAGAEPFDMAGPEGQSILDQFDEGVPYVRALMKTTARVADQRGFLRTILGRRCRFPRHPKTGKIEWTHKSLNRLIQGSSADQTKLAMVLADEAGIPMQIQVHDELDLTLETPEGAQELQRIMVDCLPLQVPTKVDIETGPSWGELK